MITMNEAHKHNAVYYGDRGDWIIAYTMCRYSDALVEANFRAIEKRLEKYGDDVAVERSNHYAFGWVDHIIVAPDNELALLEVTDIHNELRSYGVLDDDIYMEVEQERHDAHISREMILELKDRKYDDCSKCQWLIDAWDDYLTSGKKNLYARDALRDAFKGCRN
jgi:hypothetical protein